MSSNFVASGTSVINSSSSNVTLFLSPFLTQSENFMQPSKSFSINSSPLLFLHSSNVYDGSSFLQKFSPLPSPHTVIMQFDWTGSGIIVHAFPASLHSLFILSAIPGSRSSAHIFFSFGMQFGIKHSPSLTNSASIPISLHSCCLFLVSSLVGHLSNCLSVFPNPILAGHGTS